MLTNSLERGGAVSLHVQIRNLFAREIRSGNYAPGERLPSEREIENHFKVSRATIRQALVDLTRSGLIYSAAGKGYFVSAHPTQPTGVVNLGSARGILPEQPGRPARLLQREIINASDEDVEYLKVVPGTQLISVRRLRTVEDRAVAIEEAHLPLDMCMPILSVDLENRSLHSELEKLGLGPASASYDLVASLATKEEGELLGVEQGVPILRSHWTSYLADETPIEYVRSALAGYSHRFKFPIEYRGSSSDI